MAQQVSGPNFGNLTRATELIRTDWENFEQYQPALERIEEVLSSLVESAPPERALPLVEAALGLPAWEGCHEAHAAAAKVAGMYHEDGDSLVEALQESVQKGIREDISFFALRSLGEIGTEKAAQALTEILEEVTENPRSGLRLHPLGSTLCKAIGELDSVPQEAIDLLRLVVNGSIEFDDQTTESAADVLDRYCSQKHNQKEDPFSGLRIPPEAAA